MARPASELPTGLELQILKILWEQSPLFVRDIREALALQDRSIAHTSVITTLNKMVKKGYLKRKKQGKALVFSPRISQKVVSENVAADVLRRVFDGSASAVMLSLLNAGDVDEEELKALRRLINDKIREQ